MALGKDSETEKLQSLVKSCLLEINKLKMDLVKAEKEKHLLSDVEKVKKLESLINKKEKELNGLKKSLEDKDKGINDLKRSLDEKDKGINDLKRSLAEKDKVITNNEISIKTHENKIENLENFKDSFEDIKKSLEKDLIDFKTKELFEHDKKLQESLTIIAEKDEYINILLKDIETYKEKISDLKSNISNKNSILELQNQVSTKNSEIKELKESLSNESTIKTLQDQLLEKDRRINELEQMKISFDEIKSFLEKDIEHSKNQELEDVKIKLKNSLERIAEKDNKIKDLINKINGKDSEVKDLIEQINGKNSEIKDLIEKIKEKNNEFNVLRDSSVPKDSYSKLKQEINLKNDKIKRLEKIKGLFSDLDKNYSTEKNNKDLGIKDKETRKEDKIPVENDGKDNDQEIIRLKKELKTCKETNEELEKIKKYYNKLISPPKKDLTSFQSQIYSLIPEEKMNAQGIHSFIRKIAFKNLSYININNILKNLERKGYLKMEEEANDILWTKLEKE